jgi:hypothetical protein
MKLASIFSRIVPFACAFVLAACGTPGAPLPPSLELPRPVTDLRATRRGDRVSLTWTVPLETTDRQTVRHYGPTRICRSLEAASSYCAAAVGEVPADQVTAAAKNTGDARRLRFTDTVPPELQREHPLSLLSYSVETLNDHDRSAGLSNFAFVPAAPTLPAPEFNTELTADGVVITWTGILHEHEAPGLAHLYRIYRKEADSRNEVVAGEVRLSLDPEARFVDHAFEWEKTYEYRMAVVTLIALPGSEETRQVEGDSSPPVKVVAHDTFPPAVPSGLEAVFSGAGQKPFVDLTWTPGLEADLAGYNVYRREEGSAPQKLNAALVRAPAYRDEAVSSGKMYFYSISAVDLRGNESSRSQEAGEKVP